MVVDPQFTTDMLTDAPDLGKNFYVANLGAKMTYTEAVTACHSAGHSLALLRYALYCTSIVTY